MFKSDPFIAHKRTFIILGERRIHSEATDVVSSLAGMKNIVFFCLGKMYGSWFIYPVGFIYRCINKMWDFHVDPSFFSLRKKNSLPKKEREKSFAKQFVTFVTRCYLNYHIVLRKISVPSLTFKNNPHIQRTHTPTRLSKCLVGNELER